MFVYQYCAVNKDFRNRSTNLSAEIHRSFLTGRNTTGPPRRTASWRVTLHMRVLQTATDDSHQRPLLV